MKKGRVVILLAGRRAGKKAIIVKPLDEGRKVSCGFLVLFKLCTRIANSDTLSSLVLNAHPEESLVE
jgi:hypothetical protein